MTTYVILTILYRTLKIFLEGEREIMIRKPTLREEAEVLRLIRDAANLMNICGKTDHFKEIVHALDMWSYAHRVGNGENTDREQQQIINRAFWKLDDVVRNYYKRGEKTDTP